MFHDKHTTPQMTAGARIEYMADEAAHGERTYVLALGTARGHGLTMAYYTREAIKGLRDALDAILAEPQDRPIEGVITFPGTPRDYTAEFMARVDAERAAQPPPPPPCPHAEVEERPGFRCDDCGWAGEEAAEGPLYECSRCGSKGLGEDGRRCDASCGIFRARASETEDICPACEEADAAPDRLRVCCACGDVLGLVEALGAISEEDDE